MTTITPVVVFISVPDLETGREIALTLVQQNLAACVTILPTVNSIYRWDGKLYDEQENILLVKTRLELLDDKIIPLVRGVHPYETPEIIAVQIAGGLPEYLKWMVEETGG